MNATRRRVPIVGSILGAALAAAGTTEPLAGATAPLRSRRKPVQHEKVEQQHVVDLVGKIGGRVFVLGTRRGHVRCLHCGKDTPEHQGTKQTPGVSDLLLFVPVPTGVRKQLVLVFFECKANGNTLSKAQREFRDLCVAASQEHITGGLNDLYAWLLQHQVVREHQVPYYRLPSHGGVR